MNKNFVAAAAAFALLGAASAASATTFAGTWTATYNSSDSTGLPIVVNGDANSPANGGYISGNFFGTDIAFLFDVGTSDTRLDGNDTNISPFSLTLNFTAPGSGSGSISGTTTAIDARFDHGVLTWSNGGNTTANLGSAGVVNVHLNDVNFGLGSGGSEFATFSLSAPISAVPEPMSWALMLAGFGGLGAALRFSRRQGAALTAA